MLHNKFMRHAIVSATLFLSLACAATGGVSVVPVFGPETPTGRYKHPASITELTNGDLLLTWYGGDGEYEPGTAVYGSRFGKAASKWSTPVVLARDPFYSVGNPVVWQAPDGLVWLWYVIRPGKTWSSSRIAVKVSRDGARTWSDSSVMTFEEGTMVRSNPIVLRNGDYLLPVWKETGFDPEVVGADTVSFFLRYNPVTNSWTESTRFGGRLGALQPAVAQIDDAHLIAYSRRGGGYGPGTSGYIVRSESTDGGKTWAQGTDTEFPNPNAAIDLLRLRNGHLLLIYNDSPTERTPLTVAISTDNGKTYAFRKNIAVGNHDYAYPYAIQTRDGKIHVVFTSDGRTIINHAVFEESAITGR
jgi:predicted neuraminidase